MTIQLWSISCAVALFHLPRKIHGQHFIIAWFVMPYLIFMEPIAIQAITVNGGIDKIVMMLC